MKIDFNEARQDLPPDRGELARRIAETPHDILVEYIDGVNTLKRSLDENLAILHSANRTDTSLCAHLLEQLSDERALNIANIAEILNDSDVTQRIDELIEVTFQCARSSEEEKARKKQLVNELICIVKKLDKYKPESVYSYYAFLYLNGLRLARMFLFHASKGKSELALKRYLGKIDEKSLVDMVAMASSDLKVFENIS